MSCKRCTWPTGDPAYQPDLFEVVGYKVYPDRYISASLAICRGCGKAFAVIEDPGYHQPSYTWLSDLNLLRDRVGENADAIRYKK